ncbi:peptide deformylase [Vibrio coralliirubri]|uniref:peptide deformylase n=1 Tax=Vibrio coralliirubri TaxID=1516159 RepID=UPI0006307306|nr:peptide deformylase [Vibrio coralliirubri]CDU14422.1 Peptide deformylase [Vibrio coralliirubri]
MAILDIISMEDPRLRAISKPIEEINNQVTNLVQDLVETMEINSSVGLAAPQVGANICLFVINLDPKKNKHTVFINPSYESIDGSIQLSPEGCLSVGEIGARLTRLNKIRVNYTDLDGNKMVMDTKGMLSACIQHECDHLEGILFIDYLNKEKLIKIIGCIREK